MDLAIDLRIKPLDVEIPMLQTEFEGMVVEHNSTTA
jgi:hypothetical protein